MELSYRGWPMEGGSPDGGKRSQKRDWRQRKAAKIEKIGRNGRFGAQ